MINQKYTVLDLRQRQSLPLNAKIELSLSRIREFYNALSGKVYVSFSGGKDSTVLLLLTRRIYPHIPAVFADTGLEYPEIKVFVGKQSNVRCVKPKKHFTKVFKENGVPVVSKKVCRFVRDIQHLPDGSKTKILRLTGYNSHGIFCPSMMLSKKWYILIKAPFKVSEQCCDFNKKEPLNTYSKAYKEYPITGSMTVEASTRQGQWLRQGCNVFGKKPISNPLSIWTEQDIQDFIKINKIEICSVYATGIKRTGCMYCMFGVHLEKEPNRFQIMARTHPQLYDYAINKLGCGTVMDYIGVNYKPTGDFTKPEYLINSSPSEKTSVLNLS